MIELAMPFRRARSEDAPRMAELVNMAGDGLPMYLWGRLARPGQSAWDVGLERARLGLGGFAYQNTVVREVDGEVAACLIGHPRGDSAGPAGGDTPAALAPLLELGDLVATTWYLNVLATYPRHRGKGLGAELLGVAERMAREAGLYRMSLIMSDANAAARRLYERNGFRELARRAIVKEEWEHAGREWVLMVRDL